MPQVWCRLWQRCARQSFERVGVLRNYLAFLRAIFAIGLNVHLSRSKSRLARHNLAFLLTVRLGNDHNLQRNLSDLVINPE